MFEVMLVRIFQEFSSVRKNDSVLATGYALTHCNRETRKRVIAKQCRPRSDAAERGV